MIPQPAVVLLLSQVYGEPVTVHSALGVHHESIGRARVPILVTVRNMCTCSFRRLVDPLPGDRDEEGNNGLPAATRVHADLENNGSGGRLMEDGPRTPSVVWVEFVIVKGQVGAKWRAGGLRLRVKHTDEQYPSIIRGRNMRSTKCYQRWHVKKKCPNRTPLLFVCSHQRHDCMLDSKTLKQLSRCPHDLAKGSAKEAEVGSPDYAIDCLTGSRVPEHINKAAPHTIVRYRSVVNSLKTRR